MGLLPLRRCRVGVDHPCDPPFYRQDLVKALSEVWKLFKGTVLSFIDDEALSCGAAIAFYTVTSIAPGSAYRDCHRGTC
jgi:hypothetical protein